MARLLRDLIAGATNASLASASLRMARLLCGVAPSTSLSQDDAAEAVHDDEVTLRLCAGGLAFAHIA
jgi:hypothetical protein